VGVRAAILGAVLALASPSAGSVAFLQGRQASGGGFAERGGAPNTALTAWAALGLAAAGSPPDAEARAYLVAHEDQLETATDLALGILGETAGGADPRRLVARLKALERPSGTIGPLLNGTIWSVIALCAAGEPVPPTTVRYLVARQSEGGGWSWSKGGAPDSNDTAAAVEALRAVGVKGPVVARGLRFLRRFQRRDGGFELLRGRGSDAQSTAWAIQAFFAAGAQPPRPAFRYLARMRRADGSYRYSASSGATPVWVTAQVLPALVGKPFPLR
jgi:energy-coupling factor transport system substrate-specific component